MNILETEKRSKGFTIVEILVVMGIVLVLALVVIYIINPRQAIYQGQDGNRVAGIGALDKAISLYYSDALSNPSTLKMGSSSVVYISIPDPTATTTAGTNCAGIGLISSSTTYHCATPSTYMKNDGTGWVPINFTSYSGGTVIPTLPIDPINTTSSGEYFVYITNGTQYELMATPGSIKNASNTAAFVKGSNLTLFTNLPTSTTPTANGMWVAVPGDARFGTSNFYVMKYEASCANNGTPLTTPVDLNGYKDNNSSGDNCTPANGLAPYSLPNAIPIVDVSQASAITYCQNIGAHLMTNNEWQTIAWNAENVASNWSSGTVGSGYLYSGHNDQTPRQELAASSNDSQGYYGTDGPTIGGGTGAGGTGAQNQQRTLTLSNGSVIWDMSGNLWQWTNDTITGSNEPYPSSTRQNNSSTFWISDYNSIVSWGSLSAQTVGPSNIAWTSSMGLGWIQSENATDTTTYAFRRGGGWGFPVNGSFVDGIETLSVEYYKPSDTNAATGFRCAQ